MERKKEDNFRGSKVRFLYLSLIATILAFNFVYARNSEVMILTILVFGMNILSIWDNITHMNFKENKK